MCVRLIQRELGFSGIERKLMEVSKEGNGFLWDYKVCVRLIRRELGFAGIERKLMEVFQGGEWVPLEL